MGRVVAAHAGVADATLRRILLGQPVRGVSKERVEAAAAALGISLADLTEGTSAAVTALPRCTVQG